MRSRKLLALIFTLLAIAPALAGYMTLLGAGVGSIQPIVGWVSTTDPTFPSSSLTFSRTSLATMFDSTGKLTYAPNNLALYANDYSNAYWGAAFDAGNTRSVSGINFTSSTGYAYPTISGISAGAQVVASVVISTGSKTDAIGLRDVVSGTQVSIQPTATPTRYYLKITAGAVVQIGLDNRVAQGGGGGTGTLNVSGWTVSVVTYEFSNNAQSPNDYSNAYWGSAFDNGNTRAVSSINFTSASGYAYANVTGISAGRSVVASVTLSAGTKVGTVGLRDATTGAYTTVALTGTATTYYLRFTAGAGMALGLDNRVGLGGDGVTGTVNVSNWSIIDVTPRTADQVITTSAAYYGPRVDYDPNTLAVKGLLIEEARMWVALWNRDFTNAAWVKTNVTAAKDQTGIDGVSNSASSLVASASNGTVLQAITLASSQRATSAYVKRLVGSGAVSMTTDGGTTWTDITSQLGVGSYARAVIPAQTVTNPSVGFKFAASGDSIAVDYFGNENGAFQTSPLYVTSASVTRAADVVQFTGAALTALQGSAGSVIVQSISEASSSPTAITNVIKGTNSILYRDTTGKTGTTNGTTALLTAAAPTWSSAIRNGLAWSASGRSLGYTSSAIATDANTVSNGGTLYLGSSAGSAVESGWYQSFGIWNQRLPDATLSTKLTVGGTYAATDSTNPFTPKFAANDNLPVYWRIAL